MSFRSRVLTLVAALAAASPAVAFAQGAEPQPLPVPAPAAAPAPAPAPTLRPSLVAQAAQAPAPAPATPPAAAQPAAPPARVVAGQDGFTIESGNGDFRLQIGLLVHADGRFAADDTNEQVVDTFAIRRVRPYLRGRLARRFEFYLNPDFAGGTLVVHDAYIDTVFAPAFRLRAGKAKTPFGFERLHSASNLLFLERALPTALVPNRDVGVQVLGDISGGVVSYLAGVSNGVTDGSSGDLDANDSKDVSGRFIVRPFNKAAASHAARGLGLAISGSRGRQSGAGALPNLRTPTLQQSIFTYAANTTADGVRTRYSPQLWYFYKAFGGWGEFVRTETPVRRGLDAADVGVEAWQVAGSWVLSGENATDAGAGAGVRPRAPFDFGNGNWGAFQVAARYHELRVDPDAFAFNLASATASRTAEAWTAGLNWYLTGNLRYTVNFERTVFDGNATGPKRAENAIAFRSQINF